ncbi:hypothetical protein OIU74_026455 [Salix koriyanagi]|uniref:Protein YIP n=1 Tax=Salix koriyanagi TaxID=2511006 RepID=A0A9Q0VYS5_9ROSI|nr:hypothetical protein OIU74_026455 [Salix koriyanagi]
MLMIHFQNLFLVLRNPSEVVGFKHSQLLHISHTLMLTRLMFWKGSNIHFSHLEEHFTEKTVNNPDLYGPFWICTTLIFVAASIGTFVTYIAHKLQKKEWNYDINLVTWSAGVFYGYVLLVPLVLYVILKYFSAPSGLVQLFCLYGYSLFVFIPCAVPLSHTHGNFQMGDCRRGRVHVSNLCGT